jgi:hypothetical protein
MTKPKPRTPVRRTTARPRTPVRSAKPDGDAAVKAYIAALPGWKKAVAKRIDALIEREVPNVRRAIKWGMPFYGIEGQGLFVRFAAYSKHVNLRFFRGTSLKPEPPVGERERRGLHLREDDELDEKQLASWVRQAAAIPGFLAE